MDVFDDEYRCLAARSLLHCDHPDHVETLTGTIEAMVVAVLAQDFFQELGRVRARPVDDRHRVVARQRTRELLNDRGLAGERRAMEQA